MNVTIKQLRALKEVAENRSFTSAAKRLHTTQSAVSASIQELERALGIKLVDRTTRRFALTSAGEEFLPAANRILTDLNTSINNLTTLAALKRGTVILGCPPSMASALLAEAMASFRQRYPKVNIVLKDNPTDVSVGKLRSGELEIVIGTSLPPEPDLLFQPLLRNRLIAVVHSQSPLSERKSVSWRVLRDFPIVAPSRHNSLREIIDQTFLQATGRALEPVSEASFWITVLAMVESGLGVAIVPSYALQYMPARKLVGIKLTQPSVSRDVGIIQLRDRMLSPAAEAFVRHLRDEKAAA